MLCDINKIHMTISSLALQVGILFIYKLPGDLAHGWRDSNPHSLKHLAADSLALGADGRPLAFFLDGNLLQGFEIPLDVRPLKTIAGGLDTPVQFLFEDKDEKAAEHMAANGLVPLVIDRAGLKDRLGVPKDLLDLPELLILQRHFIGPEPRVGGKHPFAVKTGILFDFFLVNGKSALFTFEAAPEAAVSDGGAVVR
jgi:hypothetical protein